MSNVILNTLSVNKVSSDYPQKSKNYSKNHSFDGFLKKSNPMDKMTTDLGAKQSTNQSVQDQKQSLTDYSKKADNNSSDSLDGKTNTKNNSSINKPERNQEKNNADLEKKAKDFLTEIKDALNLTEKEINSWLASLGMVATDLFDSNHLQAFFMQVKGIDVSDLLTESNTANQLKDLLATLKNLEPNLEELLGQVESKNNFNDLMQSLTKSSESKQGNLESQPILTNILDEQSEFISVNSSEQKMNNFSEESGKTAKSQLSKQDITDGEVLPKVFSEVITTKQEVMITADGLEKVTTTVSAKDIFEQVVTKFTAENINGTGKITVQLNPEHLGKLAFQVVNREGQMTGQFVAESEAVKAALESQMAQLKLHLENQGIKVTDVKVVVGDTVNYFAEDRPKEQSHENEQKKRRNLSSFNELKVSELEEEPISSQHINEGSIDFTA